MLPSIFGESLFDDWFDFPFRGFESDVDHKLYGKLLCGKLSAAAEIRLSAA